MKYIEIIKTLATVFLGEFFNDCSKSPREDKLRIEVLRQMILGKIQPESYPAKLNARLIKLKKTHSNKK